MLQTELPQTREAFVKEISPNPEVLARLDVYAQLLIRWQRRINLIGNSTIGELWGRHFLDSAQLLRHLPKSANNLTDIGSGGGFPGLILAVLVAGSGGPTVTLIESDSRKAAFLREVNRICEANAEILNARVENADLIPADVVTARACAPLRKLLPLVKRCVRPDGVGLLMKGARWRDELTGLGKGWKMQVVVLPSLTDTSSVILKMEGFDLN